MKIAMLGHKRIPSREGGIEVVVEELAVRMVDRGEDVTCYNRKGKHVSGKEYKNEKGIKEYKKVKIKRVFTIDGRGLAAMSSSFFAALRAAVSKYDIVHFHAEGPCAMMWIPKFFGKKCVATIHGLDWQRSKWGGFATKYIKFGEKTAVKNARQIIVLSKNVQKYFKDTYGRDTIFIPNGVNRPRILEADIITKKFGLKKDEYILYLGRIVPEKGVKYLVEAFKEVKTNKKLVIAGGSSDSEEYFSEIRNLAKDNNRIIFTNFVSGSVLDELYSNSYIYTLPSDLEGMPLSLLEAMSYGNCVLGSDIDEIAEVVEDQAVLFKKSEIKDLKEKLQNLCDSPEIVAKYRSRAADFICNKYSWDDIVEKTLKIYEEIQ